MVLGGQTKFLELPLDFERIGRGRKFKISVIVAFGICLHHLWFFPKPSGRVTTGMELPPRDRSAWDVHCSMWGLLFRSVLFTATTWLVVEFAQESAKQVR